MAYPRAIFAGLTAFSLVFSTIVAPEFASGASYRSNNLVYSATGAPAPQNSPATNSTDRRCDLLADSPDDPSKIGKGVPFDQIDVAAAINVCYQAVMQTPARPRYEFIYGRVLEAAKRYADAATVYAAADQGGYALGSFNLGQLYEEGSGVPQNFAEAARLYGKAAGAGLPWGNLFLGDMYEDGLGVKQDYQRAVDLYYKAGQGGVADGYAQLGALYLRITPPNYSEAVKWAVKSVQGDSPFGEYVMGWLYEHGQGVTKSNAAALKWYIAAAGAGESDAMYRAGLMYENGQGVRQDFEAAAIWFYKAAQQGEAWAQLELGYLSYTGQGVKRNYKVAYSWFVPAARAGIPVAQSALGSLYETGEGVALDDAAAVLWFRKAAEQNNVYAMDRLGVHLRTGKGVTWNEPEAARWFQKAANTGYAPSESSLGYGYMSGLGGKQDYSEAAIWLTKAAQQGEGYAMVNLGLLYQNGWGVNQDLRQARELFSKASYSSDPQVAESGRNLYAGVAESSPRPTESTTASGTSSDKTDWVPIVAVGVVAIGLLSLFSGGSHDDSSADTPHNDAMGSMGGTNETNWPGSSSSPPPSTPICHQVPDAIGSMTPNGTDASMPTLGGGATHLECN